MNKDVIIALDFANREETLSFLAQFQEPLYVKVGMELFYQEGPKIIEDIKKSGHQIFLDLKIHDIPTTAKGALKSLSNLNIDMVNVHCAGGIEMMEAAKKAFPDTLVIAVTMLTSTSQTMMKDELLIDKPLDEVVLHYAKNAKKAGLDGIVCSPLEAKMIHEQLGDDFICVCPGIRLQATDDDQVRVTTPKLAKQYTCDYIVVGRPIIKASDSKKAFQEIKTAFKEN